MSKDLISRSHFDERVRLAAGPDADEEYTADFLEGIKVVLYMLGNEPPAVLPMRADDYLWQKERMCHSFDKATYDPRIDACEDCPLIDCCSKRGCLEGAEAVDIVEEWAEAHPEIDMITAKYALPRIDFKEGSES